ncbi:MAG: hypothetical protein J6D23_03495 [Clostridia bacterium]|nr:hypothetical protein [Clostridia bacterium]
MTREECISQIEWYIPDKTVKDLLFDGEFGTSSFLTTNKQIYECYSRILNLTFALIYAKYRDWKANNSNMNPTDAERFNSYMRITKTFSELYRKRPLRFVTIEPTIIDAQLDIFYNGIISKDMGMDAYLNRDNNNRFAYFARCAEIARTSSRAIDMREDITSKYDELLELINLFPYIRNISLKDVDIAGDNYGSLFVCEDGEKYEFNELKKVSIEIRSPRGKETYDTCFTLVKLYDKYYYLQDVIDNTKTSDCLYLNYSSLGIEDCDLRLCSSEGDDYVAKDGELLLSSRRGRRAIKRELRLNDIGEESDSNSYIRDLYAIDYRYIKQLAMSISDCLTEENKRQLTVQYSSKYNDLFMGHSWDTIIVILLVKESATNILQFLFSRSNEIYRKLLNSLQSRFGSDIFDITKLENETNEEIQSAFNRWCCEYVWENNYNNAIVNTVIEEQRVAITAELRALHLITYLSDIVFADDMPERKLRNKYPLNIGSHMKMLELLKNNPDFPLQRKKERILGIVFTTLKFLYIFYCGFFRYANEKYRYKKQTNENVFTSRQVDDFQRRANEELRKEVKAQNKRLADLTSKDIDKLLVEIKELNDECMFANTPEGKIKNKVLREMLGRYQLLDYSEIQRLEYLCKFDDVTEERIDGRIDAILEVYKYLQNGKDDAKGLDGIYPYVGTYEYSHETRDGYKISHFSVFSPGYNRDMDIEVISEFRYSINSKYYCLPNRMCCSNDIKLWIEPTVIAYSNFIIIDTYE